MGNSPRVLPSGKPGAVQGVPVAEGDMVDQARADRSPACGLDEIGLQRSLVNKDKHLQHVGHIRLADFHPVSPRLRHVGPQLFAGDQRFFYG